MKTNIQFLHSANNGKLADFIQKKMKPLMEKYDWLIKANVVIKNEKDQTFKGKICEIEISAPGPRIFASSNNESHEAAVVDTISVLERQLQKRKAKFNAH